MSLSFHSSRTYWLKSIVVPTLIVTVWHLATTYGDISSYILPSPITVVTAFTDMLMSGELAEHICASLQRVGIGFGTTAVLAIAFAMLFVRFQGLYDYFEFLFECLRAIPALAFSPLFIVWMGIGEAPKLMIILFASFFPVFLNAYGGLQNVDKKYLELGRSLELSQSEIVRHIRLPAALPQIITGLRLGFGYSWRALMGAELIAAASGLGFLIVDAEELARTDKAMAGIIVIGVLGFCLDFIFKKVTAHAIRH